MDLLERIKRGFLVCGDQADQSHKLNSDILREYDIRGVFGQTLHAQDAYDIGRAYGTVLRRQGRIKICVGLDCRLSSHLLAENLVKGLIDSGMNVITLGICHTPMMYYAVHKLNLDGGIMVTGSHNPPEYNGFKFVIGTEPFYGDDIRKLGNIVRASDFVDGIGREIIMNKVFSDYVTDVLSDFKFADGMRIAWDIGNGATSTVVKTIVSAIPGEHHLLFEEMDGRFPNRSPDPTVAKNIEKLSKFVAYNNFDIGFAFDSDGDRLAVVNSQGNLLSSDQVLEIFAKDFLKKNPGARVISEVKASNRLFSNIKRFGGIPIMERSGHSFIKAKMKSSGALLAGEMSGHFFFKDRWFGFDDGIYAALRCLELLSQNINSFNDVYQSFITPEIRISCKESEKFKIIEKVREQLLAKSVPFLSIDGIRVESERGWWLLRASNTQSVLSLRMEAYSSNDMTSIKEEVASYLEKYSDRIVQILKDEHE